VGEKGILNFEGRKTPHPVALRDHPLPKVEGYEIPVGRPSFRNIRNGWVE
jgi:hypothetical protein